MYESVTPLVLDNGSGVCKIGFAADEAPKSAFPSIVGKPRTPGIIIGTEQKEVYIGEEAQQKRGVLHISYPQLHSTVVNWEDMERVWTHAFQHELRTTTDDHPVFITEASLNSKHNREKMTQVMFEKFSINAFYVGNQSILSLYSIGKMSGLVLYSGDGVTHVDPVFEGYAVPHAIQRNDFGGRDITDILARLLADRGTSLMNSAEKQIVRDIKERLCYVSMDFDKENEKEGRAEEYVLPDDNVIRVGNERFIATEVLFNPDRFGLEFDRIDDMVVNAIGKCDIDIRKYMIENIVLSGGNTMFEGFRERLTNEINAKHSSKYVEFNVKVKDNSERKLSTWIGASILTGLSSFQQMWVSKAEYEESGAAIVHRKCLS